MSKTTTVKKAAPKAKIVSTEKKAPKFGKAHVRILKVLAKSKSPLTRVEIAEKAPADLAMCNTYIGPVNAETLEANPHFENSLLRLKYVKFGASEKGHAYEITATGRKALEAAQKA